MRTFIFLFGLLFLVTSVQARAQRSGYYSDPVVDELRLEIDDLKHALKTTQVELNLLDERLKKQDLSSNARTKDASSISQLTLQVNALEKKVSQLEKTLEKAANDLRTLSQSATQALNKIQGLEQDLSSHEKRFEEIGKLKGTLTSISKAIGQKSTPPGDAENANAKTYRVKAGDSLEKIARQHNTSAETLRKINHLSSDKIVVNQELRIAE